MSIFQPTVQKKSSIQFIGSSAVLSPARIKPTLSSLFLIYTSITGFLSRLHVSMSPNALEIVNRHLSIKG